MPAVCLITLGCPKNIVEGENLAGILAAEGCILTTTLDSADIAVVHTCSFIADARDESAEVIDRLCAMKKAGRITKVIVTGCLVQDEGKNLAARFPAVDGFIGTGDLKELPAIIAAGGGICCSRPGGLLETDGARLLSTDLPTAYLRIAEGCNHRCGFCAIPQIRGRYRSRRMESILEEARQLTAQGIKELVLVAQDTTWYGNDIYRRFALPELLKKLVKLPGKQWVRLLYAYPSTVTDDLLKVIESEEKICRYLDIPLQHASDRVLTAMRRPKHARKLVEKIRETAPAIALRTTFIVGYPGETDRDFAELLGLVEAGWFEHVGVFEYSAHPRILSESLKDKIPPAVKRERRKEVLLAQQKVVGKRNRARIGETIEVLAEMPIPAESGRPSDVWTGRAGFQAPEVDTCIYFKGKAVERGFMKVRITGTRGYDLIGVTAG